MMKELLAKKVGDTVHLRGYKGSIFGYKDMKIESVGRLYITLYDGTRFNRKTGLEAQTKTRARYVAPKTLRIWPSAESFMESLILLAEVNRIASEIKEHSSQISAMITLEDCVMIRKKLGLSKQDLPSIRKAITR